ncbi:hypothetical protein [Streptomyces sp. NPDC020607]|uniref:hypothetical protein n=1 Tax=Streptomyces sp. NPDC020607 TaxID=3365082 RepID=UPI00378819ED
MPDTEPPLTPPEAARWAARSGLPLASDRAQAVAATADHIHSVVAVLRELDFADTPPAAHRAAAETHVDETHESETHESETHVEETRNAAV